ncbi:hypothetical protein [Sinorhizobium meliloti]|uniref:hypothetical protein n=1 Tax=Rhizobium meliloti TaxID=382 RepID=UPI000FE3E873|nr:hypothetical protein [Sinorhizobium meliloti]RVM38314.1 hypothetical protein CN129_08070 [Sinorhizobium meliloti]
MSEKKIEIGDEVVVRGEVVWIDEDGVPRVRFQRTQMPIRISATVFEGVSKLPKPTKPKVRVRRRCG